MFSVSQHIGMNATFEQYRSSLYGLIPDYRGKFSEQVIETLSKYVPPEERDEVNEGIRRLRQKIDNTISHDWQTPRYELSYRDRVKRHLEHKKAYEENTPFTP